MKKLVYSLLFILNSLNAGQVYATFDIKANKSANLAFNSSGIVKKVFVDIGSSVKKGDKLAILNNDDIKAILNIHNTTLKFAKKDFDRQVKIKKIIDKARFDSYAKVYESAKAQVRYQKTLLDKTILKAPFDGVIISKEIEVGDVVSGQMVKTAFKIQSKSKRKLVLKFDQKYATSVKVGDEFKYKLDGNDKALVGVISKVYPSVDTATRKVIAEVEAVDLTVGLFGDGYITVK